MASKAGGKGSKKQGRSKIKAEGRSRPISLFIRDKISFGEYLTRTKQVEKTRREFKANTKGKAA